MNLVTASDLMRRDLAAVMQDEPVRLVMSFLHRRSLSGVPVVDEHWRLKGFFSQSDIIRLVMPTPFELLGQESFLFDDQRALLRRFAHLADRPVSEFMKTDPLYVERHTPLMDIADLFVHRKIRRLPVVEAGVLVGTVGQDDVLDYLERHFNDEEA